MKVGETRLRLRTGERKMPSLLLADELEDHRELLLRVLGQEGIGDVLAIRSLGEALRRLREAPDAWDAVLIGASSPTTEVLDACREIRREPSLAELPVVLALPRLDDDDLQRMFAAGASDWVSKPVRRSELAARVRSAIQLTREIRARRARDAELAARTRELDSALGALRQDLEAAAQMQRSLLPARGARPAGVKFAWRVLQSAEIGGDLVGCAELPDGRAALWMFDVAGHGVQAALACFALHRWLSPEPGGLLCDAKGRAREPHEVCTALSAQLLAAGDAMRYLTLCYVLVDRARAQFRVAQAGHPPLVLIRGDDARFFEAGDPPVGLIETVSFGTQVLAIEPGVRLLVYSDGLPDARSKDDLRLGQDGVLDAVRAAAARGLALDPMLDAILERVRAHAAGRPYDDDLSLLALEP